MSDVFSIFEVIKGKTEKGGEIITQTGCNRKYHALHVIEKSDDKVIYDQPENSFAQREVRAAIRVIPIGRCDGRCKGHRFERSFNYFYPQPQQP